MEDIYRREIHRIWKQVRPLLLSLLLSIFLSAQMYPSANCLAQEESNSSAEVSPKAPWGSFEVVEEEQQPLWRQALLWVPNRLLDFLDLFRVDVGAGPAMGGVVRVSKYAQAGYRSMKPGSLRVGYFGREIPIMFETSNEFGVSPAFVSSADRSVCTGEIGLGVDAFIVGGYGGICLDELADFFAGIFLIDLSDDDFR